MKKNYKVHVSIQNGDAEAHTSDLMNLMFDLGYCRNTDAGDNGVWTEGHIDEHLCDVSTSIHYEGFICTDVSPAQLHQEIVEYVRKYQAEYTTMAIFGDFPVTTEWTPNDVEFTFTT